MNLLKALLNTTSVTETLEDFYAEEIKYSSILNTPDYHLTPNEMIALNTLSTKAYKRYGFLSGARSGNVYAKVESITLNHTLGINMDNNIPLGKLLKPYDFTRNNMYAKKVSEFDEAGNPIDFRITALLYVKSVPVAMVKEWIYLLER